MTEKRVVRAALAAVFLMGCAVSCGMASITSHEHGHLKPLWEATAIGAAIVFGVAAFAMAILAIEP